MKLCPSTAASSNRAPAPRVERVEPRGDQRGQRLGDGELVEIAGRRVGAVPLDEPAVGEEHPDGLDRVQRDAVRAVDDLASGRLGQPGHEAGEQSRIVAVGSGSR